MTAYREDGTRITKAAFPSTSYADPDPIHRIDADVYEGFALTSSTRGYDAGRRLKFKAGAHVRQSEINKMFVTATVTAVDPASGPAAGGTAVTITGDEFAGVTGVTIGGVAATAVTVVNDTTVTCTTPAGTAGAKDVAVTDDSGTSTLTGGYTYV